MNDNFGDVWKFVRRRCVASSDADDLTSEVFATAWRRRTDLPHRHEQRLWLFGAARLVLANHRRSARRQSRLRLRLLQTAKASPIGGVDDAFSGGHLAAAFAELSTDDRDLLIMRGWDELSVGEIAGLLGCTPNAASLRLHRARQRLAAFLDQTDRCEGGHVDDEPTAQERR